MNGYDQRASFYRNEFAVQDDFALLSRVLAGQEGLVVDVPSGAGRLLPVHRAHGREVIMVDIEPAMTAQCAIAAASSGLGRRVTAVHGDITTWQTSAPATRVVVARGGLQILPSPRAVRLAVAACAANLAKPGILYLDVAMPWTAAPAAAAHLAPFLRFAGNKNLQGWNYIQIGDQQIRRSYTSTMLPDRVAVHFRYETVGGSVAGWQDFEADATWRRVEVANVLSALRENNLTVHSMLGDYAGTPYATGSARFICIAATA
jgi:Methyltransferase domain